jgi:cellulose synthase/poly-beta-1,6-N-acetylglucosamine synthase-like glycosyltransferase
MLVLLVICVVVTAYAYFGYPALLWLVSRVRHAPKVVTAEPATWPSVSITLPAYNATDTLRPVLEALVRTEYPIDKRQILVVSDGSTDGTDDLVREYAAKGVELLRVEGRLGKTEVENRAFAGLRGEIIVNTDASVTIQPDAVMRLVAALGDPRVGVASGRDISVASVGAQGHADEAAYVGYEMWIRDLETAADGIIGSSGCLYAIRASLHRRELPGRLSRDFSSALWAKLNGARAVSVRDAICFVPRAANVRIEYRRKIRTMSRGIQTLFYHARLLDPIRYGLFAWFLWSHKLIRWLVPFALALGAVAVVALATTYWWAALASAGLAVGLVLAATGWYWAATRPAPRLASMAAYFVSGTVAGIVAWKRALLGEGAPVWEPTPRVLAPSEIPR